VSTDPALWPAHRQADAIRARELASAELFDAFTARIERLNPAVNAVVTLDLERGKKAAAAADEAVARGDPLGPLHGLPITLKDALAVRDLRSTGGAAELAEHIPTADADVAARAFAAGAYCFAKTNVPRWSSDVQTYNDVFGTTNNPWNPSLVPGGSSGGAAAAVALGLTAFEIGTDIGGSIRIPAAYCGIAGHKPSYGLVPSGGYLDHLTGGLTDPDINAHGPLARSVEDLDLLLGVLAGPSPERAVAWRVELAPPRHERIDAFRVAVWSDDDACPVTADTSAAVEAAADVLADAGAPIDRGARPALDAAAAAGLGLGLLAAAMTPSMSDDEFAFVQRLAAGADVPDADKKVLGAFAMPHRTWLALDRDRARVRRAWSDFFVDHDVLLCPVIARPPFPHLQKGSVGDRVLDIGGSTRPYLDLVWWTILIGMAYLPSTVVPAGRTADGLPVGIQVVGPYLEDRTTIAAAHVVADRLGGITPPPLAVS
jgi:amidase